MTQIIILLIRIMFYISRPFKRKQVKKGLNLEFSDTSVSFINETRKKPWSGVFGGFFLRIFCCGVFWYFWHMLSYCKKFGSFGLDSCPSYDCKVFLERFLPWLRFVEGFLRKLHSPSKPKFIFLPMYYFENLF